jgi:dienelactone hydrolase
MATPRSSATARLAQTLKRRRDTLHRRRQDIAARPLLYASLASLVLLLFAAIVWPFTHAHLQSIAVLNLVANKQVPSTLRKVALEPIDSTVLTLPLPSGPVRARLYTPKDHPNAPALIVLHGVHHLGMDEPRMIAFASAIASCGLRVLTPELPGIKDYHIGAPTIATIGDSAKWLAEESRPPRTGHELATPAAFVPVGILGLSFSGGLSLLSAADPRWHPYIKFVVAVGSQDNMARVADYYRTGNDPRPDGTIEYLAPHEYGPLVLEYQNLEDFVPPADRPALREVLRAHLYEDPPAERQAMAKLTWFQAAQAEQLIATTSAYTRQLLHESAIRHTDYAVTVSPHGHLAHLDTPVYLLHGEADNIIPAAETQWMAAELPPHTLQAELISPVISHLDLDGLGPTALDQLRLVHFFALVLHAAESR